MPSTIENFDDEKPPACWNPTSARFRVTFLTTAVIMANSLVRNTLSMAVVCMPGSPPNHDNNSNDTRNFSHRDGDGENDMKWGSEQEGLLFSAIYLGGLITGIPAGILADRYNAKLIISVCLLLNFVGSMLTPITATEGGVIGVFILRFFMGFGGQATIFPCISAITAKWVPPNERSTVIAMYTSGSQIASVVGAPLNAFLCTRKDFLGGWPAIFYVNGFLVVPILILWLFDSTNSPDTCKRISSVERRFIREALLDQNIATSVRRIPYSKIVKSMAVLVTLTSNFALYTLNTVMTSYVPTYLKNVFDVDLRANGLYSSLPFLAQGVGKVLTAILADWLIARVLVGKTCICKTFNSIGAFGTCAFLMAAAYSSHLSVNVAVTFLTIANGLIAFQVPGFLTSLTCIAPPFSGTVNAMSRYCAQIAATVSPLIVGAIVVQGTSEEWRIIFFIITGLLSVSGILFIGYGSAEIQEWAKPENIADLEPLIVNPTPVQRRSTNAVRG